MRKQELYDKIMMNISRNIKHILNEDIQNFNTADYQEDEHDILDQDTIYKNLYIKVKNFDELREAIEDKIDMLKKLNTNILDLRDIDVSAVTTFKGNESEFYSHFKLFQGLDTEDIHYIDITGWNTSNAYCFNGMFKDCYNLKKIYGLEDLNVKKLIDVEDMFWKCKSLESLDFRKWKMNDSLEYVNCMFYGCESLETIQGLNNFDISWCDDTSYTFYNCKSLDNLDISSWDFSDVENMTSMFYNCNNLKTLKIQLSQYELKRQNAFIEFM